MCQIKIIPPGTIYKVTLEVEGWRTGRKLVKEFKQKMVPMRPRVELARNGSVW